MDQIEQLVDKVLAAVAERRKVFPRLFTLAVWGDDAKTQRDANAVFAVADWSVDRADLIALARDEFEGAEQEANFEEIADLITELARRNLRDYLVADQGYTPADAQQVAERFTLNAPLDETP